MLIITVTSIYFSLNEKLPKGVSGTEADQFARKIEQAVKHHKYEQTEFLEWTFRNKNHYLWNKKKGTVKVTWDDNKVMLDLNNIEKSSVQKESEEISGPKKQKLIKKALDNFNNDSFWVVAPHKLFDTGVTRELVTLENQEKALLVHYNSGGSTPGDSYLWKVDQNFKPVSYQMWVSILPIGGIEATWEDWTSTESGAYLSQKHQLLGFGVPIGNLRAWNDK